MKYGKNAHHKKKHCHITYKRKHTRYKIGVYDSNACRYIFVGKINCDFLD